MEFQYVVSIYRINYSGELEAIATCHPTVNKAVKQVRWWLKYQQSDDVFIPKDLSKRKILSTGAVPNFKGWAWLWIMPFVGKLEMSKQMKGV